MPHPILLLGHRGARRYAPENTFAAFDLAVQQGMDGFEFDLRLTRNRRLFVCHDSKFNRLSVRRCTLKQLQSTCVRSEQAPVCLEDVLQRYARTAFLNLEIKVLGIERQVYRIVRRFPPQRGYLISSFRPGVLRALHRLDNSLILGTLSQTRWQLHRWERLPVAYVIPNHRLLSRRLVEEIHAAKKLVVTWTVNERKEMLRVADLGVDGIISDDTKLLRETLASPV